MPVDQDASGRGMKGLTKAQRRLATSIATVTQAVRPNGRVVRALRMEGLIEFDGSAGDGLWWVIITPAGRAALTGGGDER